MSKTRTLRGGTGNGDETLFVHPTPPSRPARVPAVGDRTVNTLAVEDADETPKPKTYLFVSGVTGKGGTHIKLKPLCTQAEATVDDVLTAWKDFKANLPDSMSPVLTSWLADHPDIREEVVSDVLAIVAAETSAMGGTDEHDAITTEIPPLPPQAVRVVPPAPPEGLVTPEQSAVRTAIRERVGKIALVSVLAVPVVAAAVAVYLSNPLTALWVFLGVLSSLIFVGPPLKDAITNGLFKFVTVKLWVELGATAIAALLIGLCLLFGSVEASVALIGVVVIALLFKNAVYAAALASTKMTAIVVREEEVASPPSVI